MITCTLLRGASVAARVQSQRAARSTLAAVRTTTLFQCRAKSSDSTGEEEAKPAGFKPNPSRVNPFEGLKLDANGDLVDSVTGKALNDLGATRFDVAVQAMRGEMSKKYQGDEVRFPAPYKFQVVGKGEGTFVADMIACIGAAVGREIWEREVEVKERKGGKYVSIAVTLVVDNERVVADVFDALGKDSRVMMKF